MQEREVTVKSLDGAPLAGTLTLPAGQPRLLILMIHGTGPLDRNENMAGRQAGGLNIFNALAQGLAARGVASLRYDKRGCGASGGDYPGHRQEDLIADALAWLDWAGATHPGMALCLLGHSEGTIIAPRVAARAPAVWGVVLICPFVQRMEDILMWQARGLAEAVRDGRGPLAWLNRFAAWLIGGVERSQARLIQKLKTTTGPSFRHMGQRFFAPSLRDLLALDNRAVHAANRLPTLVLVAGKDCQCPPEDGAAIAALNPEADLVVVPDLTHILRRDQGKPGFAAYAGQLKQPMDPVVVDKVADWLDRRFPSRPLAEH